MTTFEVGEWCWFMHPEERWMPGKVKKAFKPGEASSVELEDGETYTLDAKTSKECISCDEEALEMYDNMVKMNNLNEPVILHNLRKRFLEDKVYTYIGNILIAVNPFKLLTIYTPEILDKYKDGGGRSQPPHVFAVSDYAYSNMLADQEDQSVVISGESGAGKTETMKLVLQFLAEASGRAQKKGASGEQQESLEQQILKSNPIMEAFGNAKTTRNNNSSRFGKWTEVLFNSTGAIVGGSIINYLLEKSRIPFQAEEERNYHVFYQILAGADMDPAMKQRLRLKDPEEFHYLNQSGVTKVDTINDESDWLDLANAMDVLNMNSDEKEDLVTACCAILHLGDIEFKGSNGDDEVAEVSNPNVLGIAADLFKVSAEGLTTALTKKRITGNTFKNYNLTEAADARDALAKATYSAMFDWIIHRINIVLGGAQRKEEAAKGKMRLLTIGVLDIFGFESFATNSFEQLCINYCNEKLQFHFNEHIFKLEQAEYEQEGIDVAQIEFQDNQPTLDMLEAKKTGIFAMIDEEINVPRGSDESLLRKLIQQHEKHDNFAKPRPRDLNSHLVFIVKHYAADVPYNVTNFLDKNRDTLHPDITGVMVESSKPFIAKMLATEEEDQGGSGGARRKRRGKLTLGLKFKQSLQDLMTRLNSTAPHFVRCMKPNHEKKGGIFAAGMMLDQLRNAGLLEVCRIRQIGYPVRKSFDDFVFRYRCLDLSNAADHVTLTNALSERGILKQGQWQIGHSKVFMRNQQQTELEEEREQSLRGVVTLMTSLARKYICRCQYFRFKRVIKAIEDAIQTRTDEALDEALMDAPELPFGGTHLSVVREARALKERLEEERRVQGLIDDAIQARELAELQAAVAAAKEMDPPFSPPQLQAAQQLIETIERERACLHALREAVEKRDKPQLVEVMEQARGLGKFVVETDSFKQAEALKKRMDEEDAARDALRAAIESREYKPLAQALDRLVELGLDEDLMQEGNRVKGEIEEQGIAREGIQEALQSRSLDALQGALARAEKAGLPAHDDVLQQGNALKERLDQEIAMEQQLGAACEANTMAALEEAVNAAEGMRPPLGETTPDAPNFGRAKKLLARLREVEAVKQELREATASGKPGPLNAAVRKAKDLDVPDDAPEMQEANKAIEALGAQNESISALGAACDAMDAEAIRSALARCEEMGLGDDEACTHARETIEKIAEQDRVADSLQEAVANRNKEELQRLLDAAERLKLEKRSDRGGVVAEAETCLEGIRRDDAALEGIRAAIRAGDESELAAALARARERGASPHVIQEGEEGESKIAEVKEKNDKMKELLEAKDKAGMEALLEECEAKNIEGTYVAEARVIVTRERRLRDLEAQLEKATEEADESGLNEALEHAIEMGLKGEIVERAQRVREQLASEKELASNLQACMKTLETKTKSKAGIRPEDVAPLSTAMEEAANEGLPQDSVYMEKARALQDRMERILVIQSELEDALETGTLKQLKKGMDKAEDLDLQSGLVKRVRARIRELERERNRAVMEDEDAEFDEEDLPDEDEMARMREEKFAKASHPKYDFNKYSRIRHPDDFARGVIWNKRKVKALQMRWQSFTINNSLLEYGEKELSKTAVRVHKTLLGYTGEKTMSFPAMQARDILKKGLEMPDLVDEIYLQLCKHLTRNPRQESCIRTWQVLCMCVGTFPPSRDFENYLLNFILQYRTEEGAVGNYARYALRRLEGIMNSGPSGFVPDTEEIMAYNERPPILATIMLVDGSPLTEDLPITPDLNVGKVLDICHHFLDLQDPRMHHFGIFVEDIDDEEAGGGYQVTNPLADDGGADDSAPLPKTPRPLQNENFMGDIVTVKVRQNQKFRFVYKRKIFLKNQDEPSEDPTWERLTCMQAVDEVIRGNIPLDEEEEVAVFVIRAMVVDYGEDIGRTPEELMEQELMEYIPAGWQDKKDETEWAEFIEGCCKKAGDDPRDEDPVDVQAQLIESVKDHPLYGTCFFHVRKNHFPEHMDHFPDHCIVALNSEGLHFLDPDKETLASYGYADIYRWGGSSTQFSIIIWNAETEETEDVSMFTSQAADMASLILDYIHAIMAATG